MHIWSGVGEEASFSPLQHAEGESLHCSREAACPESSSLVRLASFPIAVNQ